tara:strand:+ start:46 stop:795 length:750 start_codon:yes stop_codon:yes gene_type:complete
MDKDIKQDYIPRVTVITINYNDSDGLKTTIDSVVNQTYKNYQYLIIDGESTDGSIDVIKSYTQNEFDIVIKKDKGIYHAMNKGVSLASGEWLLFMNSGDVFLDKDSLSLAMNNTSDQIDVLYSDWIYASSKKHIHASKKNMTLRHQSVIYRKHLHNIYGTYLVSSGVTISDYIFFLSIENTRWKYHNAPLSICEEYGVSANVSHFYQKIAVDFIFKKYSRIKLVLILILYPIYKTLKSFLLKLKKIGRN